MRRCAAKVDANQQTIVSALRMIGATVQPLHTVGAGCPDLLVGFRGINYLLEVKNKAGRGRKLTSDQIGWHSDWRGAVHVVLNVHDAIDVISNREINHG